MHDLRRRLRVWFHYYGKAAIFVGLIALIVISFLRINDSEEWLNQSLLNLTTDLAGALLVIYLGIDQLKEQRDIESIPELPKRKVIHEIAKCVGKNSEVLILNSWSYLFVDSRQQSFRQAVLQAIETGVKVRIMILRPGSVGLLRRADELREKKIPVIELHYENLRWLHLLQEEIPYGTKGGFEVLFRDELPESTLYAVGETVYHAPFARKDRADLRRHLRIHIEDPDSIGWGYIDDFNRKWKDPTGKLDDYMMLRVKNVNGSDYFLYFVVESDDKDGLSWFGALESKIDETRSLNYAAFLTHGTFDGTKTYEVIVEQIPVNCTFFFIEDSDSVSSMAQKQLAQKYGKNFKNFQILRLKKV